jgi:hypothetical protein
MYGLVRLLFMLITSTTKQHNIAIHEIVCASADAICQQKEVLQLTLQLVQTSLASMQVVRAKRGLLLTSCTLLAGHAVQA